MNFRFTILALICIGLAAPVGATSMQDLSDDITALIKQAGPSVVEIQASQKVFVADTSISKVDDDKGDKKAAMGIRKRIGSGFVIDTDGYIMTTGSVVNGADIIKVKFMDGALVDGKLLGLDTLTDIALVKVEKSGLKFLEFGDSDALFPGTFVLSINNQSGMINLASLGMVSGVSSQMGLSTSGLIHISGTIGPGASGGPVLDCKGKAVGVTVAMMAPSATFIWSKLPDNIKSDLVKNEGMVIDLLNRLGFKMRTSGNTVVDIENLLNDLTSVSGSSGFAVPINKIKPVIDDLKNGKTVRRSRLGVAVGNRNGEFVLAPAKDGSAVAAGIKAGDVLVEADGRTFKSVAEFSDYILSHEPGDVVELTIKRKGKLLKIKAILGERTPAYQQLAVSSNNRVTIHPSDTGKAGINAAALKTGTGFVAAAGSGDKVVLDIKDSTIDDVVKALAKVTKKKFTVTSPSKLDKKFTLRIDQSTPEQALDAACKAAECVYRLDKDTYIISSIES